MRRHFSPSLACGLTAACLIGFYNGTPYIRRSTDCVLAVGKPHCGPPVWCHYLGLEGNRELDLHDADRCPLIVLLPHVFRS